MTNSPQRPLPLLAPASLLLALLPACSGSSGAAAATREAVNEPPQVTTTLDAQRRHFLGQVLRFRIYVNDPEGDAIHAALGAKPPGLVALFPIHDPDHQLAYQAYFKFDQVGRFQLALQVWDEDSAQRPHTHALPFLVESGATVVVGDFNGDGNADAVVDARTRGLRHGRGPQLEVFDASEQPDGEPDERFPLDDRISDLPSNLLIVDINADGYDDLVVLTPGTGFGLGASTIFLGGPSGLHTWENQWRPEQEGLWTLLDEAHVGDVNGDGFDDLVLRVAQPDGEAVQVWAAGADQETRSRPNVSFAVDAASTLALDDVTGDGVLDVVAFPQHRLGEPAVQVWSYTTPTPVEAPVNGLAAGLERP